MSGTFSPSEWPNTNCGKCPRETFVPLGYHPAVAAADSARFICCLPETGIVSGHILSRNSRRSRPKGREALKEKELRIALVCFGGVSLAIYMYGISKEILKLVRASRALHRITNRSERSAANFFDRFDRDDPEYDTDEIYFELLRDIGETLELRVIVDVIAGASAGGINGTMLARALSHDLPMGALRDLWLNHADVGDLLAPDARASAASKLILKPMIWLLGATGLWEPIKDPEVRQNLSLFVRSRWFRPPLSWNAHDRTDVQRGNLDGRSRKRSRVAAAGRPRARSLRRRHRLPRLRAADSDPQSADRS